MLPGRHTGALWEWGRHAHHRLRNHEVASEMWGPVLQGIVPSLTALPLRNGSEAASTTALTGLNPPTLPSPTNVSSQALVNVLHARQLGAGIERVACTRGKDGRQHLNSEQARCKLHTRWQLAKALTQLRQPWQPHQPGT